MSAEPDIIMIEVRATGYRLSGPPSTAAELAQIALMLGANLRPEYGFDNLLVYEGVPRAN